LAGDASEEVESGHRRGRGGLGKREEAGGGVNAQDGGPGVGGREAGGVIVTVDRAWAFDWANADSSIAARIAMIAMTTKNSD
jgi:hypothetical protein